MNVFFASAIALALACAMAISLDDDRTTQDLRNTQVIYQVTSRSLPAMPVVTIDKL